MKRRNFVQTGIGLTAAVLAAPLLGGSPRIPAAEKNRFFKISLAQWSLHRQLRSGALKVLDFPIKAKKSFSIDAVEYVNQFFPDKARDRKFLADMKIRAKDHGVNSLLIMVDAEGDLGNPDKNERQQAVENHFQWVEAAKFLGCHSIRVNASGQGTSEEVSRASTQGLRSLAEFAQDFDINILVENHGSYSSNGLWLSQLLREVDMPNCGSLPDFGNFGDYDRYLGVQQLMPFARGISAKSFSFDKEGNEVNTDFARMLRIIRSAGYQGYIGIEYEGSGDEEWGIRTTQQLLRSLSQQQESSLARPVS
ncbi:sugar phosphate isomerase/epimerase [Microbulbifer sp. OS29]|uniref:Sugar phosphate isomerase/epimerase n=1 Tax=Microbulbifer okhotskensis TaxID=2926617 RepID=A0A9X2EMH2_9GAMM|nr:sugar phosphate isomerase/epimerase family protein [Microbulbifer okhotskensis]MCO1334987.1 sugar phosphate isomerase/epimerase [Microbulbifer okhotskensis]